MSSIKCPNCNLTNFSTAQFCKRCNSPLDGFPTERGNNPTQLLNSADRTHYRQPPPNPYQQPYRPNNPPPYQPVNQPNYPPPPPGRNYAPVNPPPPPNQHYRQEQSYQYTLPRFPQDERPPQYQNYRKGPYQKAPYYPIGEMPVRRYGQEIALHKNSSLPEFCVSCGKPVSSMYDGEFVHQKFRWHPPAVYAALVSPLIYVILAACLSTTFSVNVPLCGEHVKSRESLRTTMIVGGLLSFLLAFFCCAMGAWGFGIFLIFVVTIVLCLIGEYGYKPLRVKRIESSHYYLTGASEEFMKMIPY